MAIGRENETVVGPLAEYEEKRSPFRQWRFVVKYTFKAAGLLTHYSYFIYSVCTPANRRGAPRDPPPGWVGPTPRRPGPEPGSLTLADIDPRPPKTREEFDAETYANKV